MDRFYIPVSPDEDFPEVVRAERLGEGFEKEYVEYEPRWRLDRQRRAVVADEKFFYAMADTTERLAAENAKLRPLVKAMYISYAADCPTTSRELLKYYASMLRKLGIEVPDD